MCVWVEDADKLDYDSKELHIVYYNRMVKSYLNSRSSSLGLAGVKGQGKTFLIKVKRSLIGNNKSVLCFPKTRMVDTIDSSIVIDRSLFKYLKDYTTWVNLWKYAICSSILSQEDFFKEVPKEIFQLSQNTESIIKANKRSEPSFVMTVLLNKNIQDLKLLLGEVGQLVTIIRGFHQSICFFIDKLDQSFSDYAKSFNADSVMPLRSRNASIWQYAQYSLAEASYDIYNNTNHHVKIYFTIRHEALIDSEIINKDKARNMNAYITKLEYNKTDLKEMYDLYICNETTENLVSSQDISTMPSKAFIGLETIPHGYVDGISENVFDYIFRHTFKRPYDMMKICHALYLEISDREALSEIVLRQIVNNESNKLLDQYLQELSIFLPCPIEEIYRLLTMIPGNVLSLKLMNQFCNTHYRECDERDIWRCNQNCEQCRNSQVFTILYNLGLIGYYRHDPCDVNYTIIFENIGNRILDIRNFNLPISSHYYLHPALSDKAKNIRGKSGLPFFFADAVVGDCYEVDKDSYKKIKSNISKIENQARKERVFVSSTIYDLKEERTAIQEIMYQNHLHPVLSEKREFDTDNTQQSHSHDVCLDEVKKCKSFIFIVGREYGGIYSGENYAKEKDEICTLSNGKITQPSISLLEYYIARKHKLHCYVFASTEIEEKKRAGDLDVKMKAEIDFINHFRLNAGDPIKGNWINWYQDINDLKARISRCRFN